MKQLSLLKEEIKQLKYELAKKDSEFTDSECYGHIVKCIAVTQ